MIMSEPYSSRRTTLMDTIGGDAALILASPLKATRSHDTHYRYRTDSDLYYLTGFTEPGTILVLTPGHSDGEVHLFVRPRDPLKEQWDGYRKGPQGVERDHGIERGHILQDFEDTLPRLLAQRRSLYHTRGGHDVLDRQIDDTLKRMRSNRNKHDYAPSQIHDVQRLLRRMRAIKDEHELDLMRVSAQIASEAHQLAMGATRPGMKEYELQALIEYHFTKSGAQAPAYETIVAGGAHANVLHYVENSDTLRDGDMVLIDAGCEYHYYASDITRTWPINGTFTGAQRDLYQAVLTLQLELIEACHARPTVDELTQLTTTRTVELLKDLNTLTGPTDRLIEEKAHKPYAPHSFGHWLGMDVHDPLPYRDAQGSVRCVPGHVLTIEPGLYIPSHAEHVHEGLRGQGVRIEDDVLITPQGVEVLTHSCPKEIEALEAVIGSRVSEPVT